MSEVATLMASPPPAVSQAESSLRAVQLDYENQLLRERIRQLQQLMALKDAESAHLTQLLLASARDGDPLRLQVAALNQQLAQFLVDPSLAAAAEPVAAIVTPQLPATVPPGAPPPGPAPWSVPAGDAEQFWPGASPTTGNPPGLTVETSTEAKARNLASPRPQTLSLDEVTPGPTSGTYVTDVSAAWVQSPAHALAHMGADHLSALVSPAVNGAPPPSLSATPNHAHGLFSTPRRSPVSAPPTHSAPFVMSPERSSEPPARDALVSSVIRRLDQELPPPDVDADASVANAMQESAEACAERALDECADLSTQNAKK